MEVSPDAVYARREDVVLREIAGEHLLVPIRRDVADMQAVFALNAIGVYIWELLDGERTLGAVLAAILDRFDVGAEEAQADLRSFVERLRESGIALRQR
jgi:hypothetical protein